MSPKPEFLCLVEGNGDEVFFKNFNLQNLKQASNIHGIAKSMENALEHNFHKKVTGIIDNDKKKYTPAILMALN